MRDSRRLVGGGGWVKMVGPDDVAGATLGVEATGAAALADAPAEVDGADAGASVDAGAFDRVGFDMVMRYE